LLLILSGGVLLEARDLEVNQVAEGVTGAKLDNTKMSILLMGGSTRNCFSKQLKYLIL
jgi:hypothetical protein